MTDTVKCEANTTSTTEVVIYGSSGHKRKKNFFCNVDLTFLSLQLQVVFLCRLKSLQTTALDAPAQKLFITIF